MNLDRIKKLDDIKYGIIAGIIGAMIGFFINGFIYMLRFPGSGMGYFIHTVFLGTIRYIAPILSLSLIFNVLLFFGGLKLDMDRFSKGILISFFIFAPFIIFFHFYSM